MSETVINNAAQHRFELTVSRHLAASSHKLVGDIVTFEHTEVPAERRASALACSRGVAMEGSVA